MKKYLLPALFIFQFFSASAHEEFSAGTGSGRTTGSPYFAELPDTLPNLEEMLVYLHSDIGRAKEILDIYLNMDLTVRRKLYTDGQVNSSYGDYLYTVGRYREMIKICEEYVLTDPVIYGNKMSCMLTLDQMMEASRMINDFEGTMKYALRLLESARKAGDRSLIGRAYMYMGKTQYRTGDKAEGLRYFDLARENLLAGNDPHWLSTFYLAVANINMEYSDYREAYRYAVLYEKSLDDMEALYDHQNELFIEIYKGRAYVIMTEILFKLGREAEAAGYYRKFLRTWNATDPEEGSFIVPYLLSAGRYPEAENYVLRYEEFLRTAGDTISDNMLTTKDQLQRISEAKGQTGRSFDYLRQVRVITDSLRRREQQSSALELAAVYETAQKEALIADQREEIRVRRIYTSIAIVIAGILLGVVALTGWFIRSLNRKNRLLVKRIRQHQGSRDRSVAAVTGGGVPATGSALKRMKGDDLFHELERIMVSDKLYQNKNLLRDDVAFMLGTNKTYLTDAIQANTGMNFTDYVNHLRLESSLSRLSDTDEIISAVAAKCGFGGVSSFHRLFINKYGMSPNTYRKLSRK